MKKARYLYTQWGADAKAEQLRENGPGLSVLKQNLSLNLDDIVRTSQKELPKFIMPWDYSVHIFQIFYLIQQLDLVQLFFRFFCLFGEWQYLRTSTTEYQFMYLLVKSLHLLDLLAQLVSAV